jgi:hypothetical protein
MELKKANHGLRMSGTDDEDLLMSQMSAGGATRSMERTAMTCDAKGRILHIVVKILLSLFEKNNQAYRPILAKAV